MIKKLQEEWEKLSQEAQAGGNDPTRQHAIVERMNAVSGALRKLSQGSVTRTTLSQAVRESLDRILSESKDSLFPDLARQSEVDRGLSLLEGRLKEIEASLGRRLESLESRIDRELGAAGGQNGGALHGVSRQILEDESRIEALERRLAESSARVTEEKAERDRLARVRFDELAEKGGELERKLAELEARTGELGGGVQAAVQSIRALEARLNGRLDGVLRSLESRDEVESGLREAEAKGRDLEPRLQAGLEEVRGELRRKEEEARRAEGLLAQVRDQVGGLAAQLETLRSQAGEFGAQARDAGAAITYDLESRLNGRLEELLGEIARRDEAAASRAEGLRSELGGRLEGLAAELEALRSRAGEIEAQARDAGEAIGRDLDSRLNGRVDEALGEIARRDEEGMNRAAGLRSELGGIVEGLAGELEALRSRAGEIEAQARDAGEAIGRDLESRLNGRLEEALGEVTRRDEEAAGRAEGLRSELGGRVEGLAGELEALRSRAGEIEAQARDAVEAIGRDLESRLNGRVEEVAADLRHAGEELASKLREEISQLSALGNELETADDNLAEGLRDLELRMGGRIDGVESAALSRQEALEAGLSKSLAGGETRMREAQGQFERQLSATLGAQIATLSHEFSQRIESLEIGLAGLGSEAQRLQKEMDTLMEQIEEKVTLLVDMVGQIQSGIPSRQLFEGLDERLGKIEGRVRTVSDQIGAWEESLAELKLLGEQLAGIRGEVGGLGADLSSSSKESSELLNIFSRKIQDLQDLLRSAQERWESDRSNSRQRLSDLRDSLRDQLRSVIERSEGGGQGPIQLLGKLLARPDGGLRLGLEEWERLRTRLTMVIDGLEALLTESR
jgi:chromosome segregation ATPase